MKNTICKLAYQTSLVFFLVPGINTFTQRALAQIKTDNTLGTQINSINSITQIDGGFKNGSNLFHSFQEFNVNPLQTVNFFNPPEITNILTRVTGGHPSQISGTLGVTGTANLFLINPNGIIFGKDAVLDIKGSFTATTADSIKLGENGLFSATNPQNSNLLDVQPSALFRNAIKNQTSITNQGNLQVPQGKNITLFAANVINIGTLAAPGGIIQLTGTEDLKVRGNVATGTLLLDTKNLIIGENNTTIDKSMLEGLSGNTNLILQATNDITINSLSNKSLNLASGSGKITFTADADSNGVGNLQMNMADTIKSKGRNIEIKGVNLILGSIETNSELAGGNITLNAKEKITTESLDSSSSSRGNLGFTKGENGGVIYLLAGGDITTKSLNSSSKYVGENSSGNGGNITLTTNGGSINTGEINSISKATPNFLTMPYYYRGDAPSGNGGNIKLTANGIIKTKSITSSSSAFYSNTGNGGDIQLIANNKIITENLTSSVDTLAGSPSNGGHITLLANGFISAQSLNSSAYTNFGSGKGGGDIQISANNGSINLESINSGSANFAGGIGKGGNISLTTTGGEIYALYSIQSNANLSGNINISVLDDTIFIPYINASANGDQGIGGTINITAQKLNLHGNIINSNGDKGSNGGQIKLIAPSMQLKDTDISSSSFNGGRSGKIDVIANDDITLDNSRLVTSLEPGSTGIGGDITIQAQNLKLSNLSLIDTGTYSSANAGNIKINAENVTLTDSSSIRSLTTGTGNAGNVILEVKNGDISLNNSSSISTSASRTASGNSGNITLLSRNLTLINGSQIQTLTEGIGTSKAGEIIINADANIKISGFDPNFTPFDTNALPPENVRTSKYYINSPNGGAFVDVNRFFPINDIGTNHSIATAQKLTATNFTININTDCPLICIPNPNVEYSSRIPYASIRGVTDNKPHVYEIKVNSGTRAIFDVDGSSNAKLTILNSQGQVLASNNGASYVLGREGSTSNQDPYLRYIFNQQGTYYIQLSKNVDVDANGVNQPLSFNLLQISLEANPIKANLTNSGQPSGIFAYTTGAGKAGNINLNTNSLNLENGSSISAFTNGSGNGGTININANNSVNLGVGVQNFAPVVSVETNGAGKAGDININTPNFTLSETARITATATKNATNTEGGGSITLNASKMNLAGIVGIFAETQGQAPAGTLKLNPYQNQHTLDLTLFPNSTISASTTAQGKGGDLMITAPENINISGQGKLAVESTGSGDAGNIFINAQNLNITDGVKISASTSGTGKGGNINVNANKFTANNGAQLLTTTSGNNQAGNINLQVKDHITLDGINTGLFANTEIGSTDKSGNITIGPKLFIIKNGAGIGVNSQGSGEGGSISITAGTLRLENQGFISAETASNQGGNINLNINDLLWLRNNSQITATAGTAGAGGNGGNININTPFIIGLASENSDITANAFKGNGGNINITTNTIFGLKFQPQPTEFSDITVSSQFGLSGQVIINNLDIDPSKGILPLPANFVDNSNKLAQGCSGRSSRIARERNRFNISGKGGLASHPDDVFTGTSPMVELVDIQTTKTSQESVKPVVIHHQNHQKVNLKNREIQQAQGWVFTNDGKVILTAQTSQAIPQNTSLNNPGCEVFSQ